MDNVILAEEHESKDQSFGVWLLLIRPFLNMFKFLRYFQNTQSPGLRLEASYVAG